MDAVEALLHAMGENRQADALALVEKGLDLNEPVDNGASPLFTAVLLGDLKLVEAMLQHGADPNFRAMEPACYEYAQTPLDLAMGARFLINWDKFHPIVTLLISHGALGSDGEGEIPDLARAEAESRTWQKERQADSPPP